MKSLIKAIMQSSSTTDQITPEDYKFLDAATSELVSKISAEVSKFLPCGIKDISKDTDVLLTISKGRRQEDLLSAFNLIFPRLINEIIGGLTQIVEGQLQRLRYLGPLRSYPPRHLAFSQYHDPNWQAGGGSAWEEVRKDPELRKKINEWLGDINKLSTPYELIVQHLLTIDDLEKHYSKRVDDIEKEFIESGDDSEDSKGNVYQGDLFGDIYGILDNLKKIEQNIAEVGELVLVDKRTGTTVSHRDVGIGISQVLPVLVSAYANNNAIVAIEQPEIHLHPALQAELGVVFIEAALGKNKNTLILETHSEHLILRLLRRIRETTNGELKEGLLPLKPNDISIIYAKPDRKGTTLIELHVTEDGEFLDKWPDGFFTERAKELF